MKIPPKPTHVYIGRAACGCVRALTNDYGDKETGKDVAEFIASGLTIERIAWADYVQRIAEEPTFFKCPHGKQPAPIEQPGLFAGEPPAP